MELPPEILQIIFSFCSISDLLESVQYVCQKWHESAVSVGVWRNKTLQISKNSESKVLKLLLNKMTILRKVWFQDVTNKTLSLISDKCSLLKYLRIDCCDLPAAVVLLPKFTYLTYIDLCFKDIIHLETLLQNSDYKFPSGLCTVVLRRCIFDDMSMVSLLETCKFLQHLVISQEYELESFLESSLESPDSKLCKTPGNHNLNTLYLCKAACCINNTLLNISRWHNLKYLALKHNQFYDNGLLQTIFKEPCPILLYLDLSYSYNLTCGAIISVITACPNLVTLSLMRCEVDNDVFSTVMNTLLNLQHLNLHGTQVTSRDFLDIPHKLPKLKDLNVCACRRIDEHVLSVLVELMPNLIIFKSRKGILKGAHASERHHPFLIKRNALCS